MRKETCLRGLLIVVFLLTFMGYSRIENDETYTNTSITTTKNVKTMKTGKPDSSNEKTDEYSITGGKSDLAIYAKAAGHYPKGIDYFAFEEDFDGNEQNEAFVIIGTLKENKIKGDIWFVNYNNKAFLLKEHVLVNKEQQIYRGKIYSYLLVSYTEDGNLITDIYDVIEDQAGEAFSRDGYSNVNIKYIKDGKLIMVDSANDHAYDKVTNTSSGLTSKTYYYDFTDDHFENVQSVEKTEEDFKTYLNAEEILKELKEEYHPTAYQFIFRDTGEWNVNMAVEHEQTILFNYATYRVNEDSNTLILVEKGDGYYRLDLSNIYRDFLTLLLNEEKNNNLQTWLTMAMAEGMTIDEAQKWYQRFRDDNIFMDGGYISSGLQYVDADSNGKKDVFLLTSLDNMGLNLPNNPEYNSYFYVYMNKDSVYQANHNHYKGFYYHNWYQDIVSGDFDNDGYIEIGFNIFTGGSGGAGSSYKGILKYRNHTFEEMKLPNDLEDKYGDVGITVKVLAGAGKNSYVAYCPSLEKSIHFSAPNATDDNGNRILFMQEGEEAGGNVRGYYNLEVIEKDGREYMQLKEYLHGEGGINVGVGDAVFLVDWKSSGEAYVIDFFIQTVEE